MGSWTGTTYRGDSSSEWVVGTAASEEILLGPGNDTAIGGGGDDAIDGGDGDDVLFDFLFSGDGSGVDTLIGGAGNDELFVTRPGAAGSLVDGGADDDVVTLGNLSNVLSTTSYSFVLTQGGSYVVADGVAGTLVRNVERVNIQGADASDTFVGGAGNDTLVGNGGDDLLAGGAGDDVLDAGRGRVDIDGGLGTDSASFSLDTSFDITLTTGDLTLAGGLGSFKSIERFGNVILGDGDDTVSMGDFGGRVDTASGDDTVTGGLGNDTIASGGGSDVVFGGAGDDFIGTALRSDLDRLDGGTGTDRLLVDGDFSVTGAVEVVLNVGGITRVRLDGVVVAEATSMEALSVSALRGTGSRIVGGAHDDYVHLADGNDSVVSGGGDDYLALAGGSDTVDAGDGDDIAQINFGGTDDLDMGAGNDRTDIISVTVFSTSTSGHSVYDGGEGFDEVRIRERETGFSLDGDTLRWDDRTATLLNYELLQYFGTRASTSVTGGSRNDLFEMLGGDDTVIAGSGDDTLGGGEGADVLNGGIGIDTASYASSTGVRVSLDGSVAGSGEALGDTFSGIENILGSAIGADHLVGNGGGNLLAGQGGDDTLVGGGGNDRLEGGDGNDRLDGGDGADWLVGGVGVDTLIGGLGNDTYVVDGDRIAESSVSGGVDTVQSSVSYVLSANLENLILAEAAAINGTGNGLGNAITGNAAANVLNGGAGADTLAGGLGNDFYYVDNAGDRVAETAGGGTDTVASSVSYVLIAGQEIENLSTTGSAGTAAIKLTGNEFGQTLRGNAGANSIDGRGGADIMYGFGGDDIFYVDNTADRVFEAAGGGTDRVASSVSYVLAAGQHVEILQTTTASGTTAISLTGNEVGQTVTGNAGANILNGRGGADHHWGLGGNDTYYVDSAGDRVYEASGQGSDLVATSTDYTLQAGQWVETLQTTSTSATVAISLAGNEIAQVVKGNYGTNVIYGRGGDDALYGYGGTDTFVFDTGLGASNRDTIADFSHAADTIRLDKSVFTTLAVGNLASAAFKDLGVAGAVIDGDDRILYNRGTGALFYDADGSGTGAAVQFATLLNRPTDVDQLDFVIVA